MNIIVQKIIAYLFARRLKSYLDNEQREKRFVNYQSARSVLILFESDEAEDNTDVRRIIQRFVADGKKVMAWGYVHKKEINTAILPDFRILNQKDADFTHFPEQMYLRELENLSFDLVIDLTVNEIKLLQYIALYADAACKVGTHNYPGLYDLLIDVSHIKEENSLANLITTPTQIFDHLIFYLKSIQTND